MIILPFSLGLDALSGGAEEWRNSLVPEQLCKEDSGECRARLLQCLCYSNRVSSEDQQEGRQWPSRCNAVPQCDWQPEILSLLVFLDEPTEGVSFCVLRNFTLMSRNGTVVTCDLFGSGNMSTVDREHDFTQVQAPSDRVTALCSAYIGLMGGTEHNRIHRRVPSS